MFDVPNPDVVVPLAIVGVCALIGLLTHALTRPRQRSISVPVQDSSGRLGRRREAETMEAHQAVAAPVAVSATDLAHWHRQYGAPIQYWIQNHEAALDQVADQGLHVNDISAEIVARQDVLAPTLQDAIQSHPAPPMRAQLSGLVVASQATLTALERSDFTAAERQHLTYLEYRDEWLDRLRQFTANDLNASEIQNIAAGHRQPGWS